MKVNKKQIVMLTLTLVVCVAVYLNWRFLQNDATDPNATTPVSNEVTDTENQDDGKVLGEAKYVDGSGESVDEYFTQSRLTRQQSKDDAIELLKTVVNSDESSAESKEKANNEIVSIANSTEKEGIIENLIKAKGFNDCVVFISSDSVNVVVSTSGLTAEQAAQIKEIVVSQTDVSPSGIKIVEIKSE
jgi:hypothetical protein